MKKWTKTSFYPFLLYALPFHLSFSYSDYDYVIFHSSSFIPLYRQNIHLFLTTGIFIILSVSWFRHSRILTLISIVLHSHTHWWPSHQPINFSVLLAFDSLSFISLLVQYSRINFHSVADAFFLCNSFVVDFIYFCQNKSILFVEINSRSHNIYWIKLQRIIES